MVARDVALAELTGTRVHIAHVSTAAAARLLRDAKARGVPVTGEVTPHHLLLTDETMRRYDANAKMAPPLRSKRDVEACREALADGTLDAIATDHAPHALSDKEVELEHAANGIVGLETAVALCLTHLVRERVLDLPTLVARLTMGPARVLDLPGGSLRPGGPGDVTILDLEREHVIDPARFHSKGRNTPFAGWRCVGAPWMTVVAGRVVMQEGRVTGGPAS
jgi:dihydroorotase